jgi:hypothetical protein
MNNCLENSNFVKSDKNKINLQEAVCTFIIISHLILYKTRNASSSFAEGIKTHILC